MDACVCQAWIPCGCTIKSRSRTELINDQRPIDSEVGTGTQACMRHVRSSPGRCQAGMRVIFSRLERPGYHIIVAVKTSGKALNLPDNKYK